MFGIFSKDVRKVNVLDNTVEYSSRIKDCTTYCGVLLASNIKYYTSNLIPDKKSQKRKLEIESQEYDGRVESKKKDKIVPFQFISIIQRLLSHLYLMRIEDTIFFEWSLLVSTSIKKIVTEVYHNNMFELIDRDTQVYEIQEMVELLYRWVIVIFELKCNRKSLYGDLQIFILGDIHTYLSESYYMITKHINKEDDSKKRKMIDFDVIPITWVTPLIGVDSGICNTKSKMESHVFFHKYDLPMSVLFEAEKKLSEMQL